MRLASVPTLLLSCRASLSTLAQEDSPANTPDLDVDILTSSFKCSHQGKEWH
ncbi:hypothetical protein ACHAW6_013869, partial [Cyclotella cf. meneghiniana]